MKAVVQRVLKSNVIIDNDEKAEIKEGLMILVGFTYNDNEKDIEYIVKKVVNLRIFEENNKMNLSIMDINGEILLIPQFTLYADCRNGNRPSFTNALEPKLANELFKKTKIEFEKYNINMKYGKFGSDMKVELINNGPVTIILDSKER